MLPEHVRFAESIVYFVQDITVKI